MAVLARRSLIVSSLDASRGCHGVALNVMDVLLEGVSNLGRMLALWVLLRLLELLPVLVTSVHIRLGRSF